MKKNPIISIVIPCYNHGLYINEAIKSVEEYENDDYEIIIINDGSTDDYTNIKLNELKKTGYNVIFQPNQGLGKTRNNGIKISRGKYILPLDADNKISKDFIPKCISILENKPSVSIVYSDRQLFGNSDELINVGNFDHSSILTANFIDACAIFRKSVWKEINGYDEKMPLQGWEDWEFWLSAASRGFEFFYIQEPLFYYRVLDNSMIKKLNSDPNLNRLRIYVYKKHLSSLIKQNKEDEIRLLVKLLEYELEKLDFEADTLNFEREHLFRTSIKYMYRWICSLG